MVLDSKKIVSSLKKKGFIDAKHKSIDHKYFEFYHKNNKLVSFYENPLEDWMSNSLFNPEKKK